MLSKITTQSTQSTQVKNFKTLPCYNVKNCKFGSKCKYYHSPSEMKEPVVMKENLSLLEKRSKIIKNSSQSQRNDIIAETSQKYSINLKSPSSETQITSKTQLIKKNWCDVDDDYSDDDEVETLPEIASLQISSPQPLTKKDLGIENDPIFENRKVQEICGEFSLYHRNDVNMYSSDEKQAIRGIICHNDKVVVKAFPFTPEFSIESDEFFSMDFRQTDVVYMESWEGTQLRMWFNTVENKWFLSTVRKIDANKSCWRNNTSFRQIFDIVLEEKNIKNFEDGLDKSLVYVFLLTSSINNSTVSRNSFNNLYCLGSFDSKNRFQYNFISVNGLSHPTQLNIRNKHELRQTVENFGERVDEGLQGILMLDIKKGKLTKIISTQYEKKMNISGNTSSLEIRYLEVRKDKSLRTQFVDLFNNKVERFKEVETAFKDLGKSLLERWLLLCKNVFVPYKKLECQIYNRLDEISYEGTYVTVKHVYDELEKMEPRNQWVLVTTILDKKLQQHITVSDVISQKIKTKKETKKETNL